MIFREASYVRSENSSSSVNAINDFPDGAMDWSYNADSSTGWSDWRSALQTRACVVLVCRRWNHIGTPLLYSSFSYEGWNSSVALDSITDKLNHARHIRVMDIGLPPQKSLVKAQIFIPFCTNLRRFKSSGLFAPVYLLSLFSRRIQDLTVTVNLEQIQYFANISMEFQHLESLELLLILGDRCSRQVQHFQSTKVNLPKLKTLILIYEIRKVDVAYLPLTFSCPLLENLIIRHISSIQGPILEDIITDSLELSYIYIEYSILAAVEQKHPGTLFHPHLKRVCLKLKDEDNLSKICTLLNNSMNVSSIAIEFGKLENMQNVDRLFTCLTDKSSTPKLVSVYFSQHEFWRSSNEAFIEIFVDFLEALRRRGVGLFVENPFSKISNSNEFRIMLSFYP